MGEVVAVVGSRFYPAKALVCAFIRALPKDTVLVTGAWWTPGREGEPTRGVDEAAAWTADDCGLVVALTVGSRQRGKGAGLQRNVVTVELAHRVVAFWDETSRGTARTMSWALSLRKPLEVFGKAGDPLDGALVLERLCSMGLPPEPERNLWTG